MKLTKKIVDGLPLPQKGQRFIWDQELKGFGVRLNPSGKTYIVQSRVKGIERRVSLGRHGVITADDARKKAIAELSKMLEGIDPAAEKAREKAYAKTLRELADEYIKAHGDLKASSISDINKHVNRSFVAWMDKPAVEITRDAVAVKFRELSERSSAQANQAFRVLRALLNYARAAYRPGNKPTIVENPVDILSQTKVWNRVTPKSAKIPLNEIGLAWNCLQSLREDPAQTSISRAAADIICFLLLTGCRFNEAAALKWEQVNFDQKSWHLPDPKNRTPVTFPLSDVAAAILEARKQKGPYVFASWGDTGHITVARRVTNEVSEAIGTNVSAHDLRRTFRAIAGACNIDFWKTKLLMGHKISGDVTIAHYTETSDLRYLSNEINTIAEWITAKSLEATSGNVVPISTQGGKR